MAHRDLEQGPTPSPFPERAGRGTAEAAEGDAPVEVQQTAEMVLAKAPPQTLIPALPGSELAPAFPKNPAWQQPNPFWSSTAQAEHFLRQARPRELEQYERQSGMGVEEVMGGSEALGNRQPIGTLEDSGMRTPDGNQARQAPPHEEPQSSEHRAESVSFENSVNHSRQSQQTDANQHMSVDMKFVCDMLAELTAQGRAVQRSLGHMDERLLRMEAESASSGSGRTKRAHHGPAGPGELSLAAEKPVNPMRNPDPRDPSFSASFSFQHNPVEGLRKPGDEDEVVRGGVAQPLNPGSIPQVSSMLAQAPERYFIGDGPCPAGMRQAGAARPPVMGDSGRDLVCVGSQVGEGPCRAQTPTLSACGPAGAASQFLVPSTLREAQARRSIMSQLSGPAAVLPSGGVWYFFESECGAVRVVVVR